MTKWINKEVWLTALKRQQSHVRMYEADGRYSPKQIEKQRQSLERIWNAGLPEWRAAGKPSRLP